jgi:hypothetical protein
MGQRTRRLTSLLVSITSGAGAVALLIGTLLGAGTLNCGERSFVGDGACEPICELLSICTGGPSGGSGPDSPGWMANCFASCISNYTTSTPGSLSGGKSSRQKIVCGAKATSCTALDACLK